MGAYKNHDQICWDCQNAYAHKCSWFADFTSVEGWMATPCKIKSYNKVYLDTYHITACPNYIADPPFKIYKTPRYNSRNTTVLKTMPPEPKTNFDKLFEHCFNNGISFENLISVENYAQTITKLE